MNAENKITPMLINMEKAQQLSDSRLAEAMKEKIWSNIDMTTYEAALVEEAIERLDKTRWTVLPLLSVDFEENTITVQATPEIMKEGFHAGKITLDLHDVQSQVFGS